MNVMSEQFLQRLYSKIIPKREGCWDWDGATIASRIRHECNE